MSTFNADVLASELGRLVRFGAPEAFARFDEPANPITNTDFGRITFGSTPDIWMLGLEFG